MAERMMPHERAGVHWYFSAPRSGAQPDVADRRLSPDRRLPLTRTFRLHPLARLVTATLAAMMAVAACSSAAPPADSDTGSQSGRPSHSPPARISPDPSAPVTGEVPAAIVDAARALLADAVGTQAATAATLLVAEAVTWPDGSMGCPEPGVMYTQQLVPGYRLVFEVDGASYDYRASEGGELRHCGLGGPRAS
jgi:hypothetical protein